MELVDAISAVDKSISLLIPYDHGRNSVFMKSCGNVLQL
ncbi:hypothetical protein ATORI0001_0842 [Lancefieldella rimae ATCC 49626]|uniref:Uncharacterized protein n=1 Tax=Lancefieldella rimae (strain ATCC 49626 / DSM 7090 / CCUG 31168 / NBRC 15546 / VPI D140H-11A) TaxID=553184 RepID=B9CLC3_LANR4|nr:hypothetical protein ATORI0001_0842 [Lancefieldella rimae ATCC 49626]